MAKWRIYASVNHITVGTDNGLSPMLCLAMLCTNDDLLSTGTLQIKLRWHLNMLHCLFSFKKMHLNMPSEKRWPFGSKLFTISLPGISTHCGQSTHMCLSKPCHYYTPRTTKLLGGYTGFTPSVRPSVCPSVRLSVRPSVPHAVSALYHLQLWMDSFHIRHKWSLPWEGVSRTMTFDLDLYLQGHLALT